MSLVREPMPEHLRLDEVRKAVPYSKVHLYRLVKEGKFPRPVRFGENRVAWNKQEILAWIGAKRL